MRTATRLSLLFLALPACHQDANLAGHAPAAPRPATLDRYESVGTNPFVETAHDPFATFAIDVDTASYDIFRRDVEAGRLPDPASVRLEEYVNSFEYAYPAPAHDAAVPFAISLGGAPSLAGGRTSILRVGIQGKAPPRAERLPANVVFLVDTSCSMQGPDRLELVQHVLRSAVDALAPTDTVSIVTYAGHTSVALPATPGSDRAAILHAIDAFSAGGSTAGGAGIDLAYEQAESAFVAGGFNHVVLCTDGDFNVGASSDEALVALIRSKRESGITFTALGFGTGNLNDAMMEKVSNAGNGFYSVISGRTRAAHYGAVQLFQTIELIARDVKVQVELNPQHVEAYRLLGYENRLIADDDFADDRVDGGEIGSGHRVTALFEIVRRGDVVPTHQSAPTVSGPPVDGERTISPGDAVTVRVRYKAPAEGDADAAREVSASLAPGALAASETGDPDTMFAAALAAFAEILKQSPYADPAQLDAIAAVFAAQAGRDAGRAELAALFAQARPLLGR